MSTQTLSSTSLAGLPRVNLLPPEIAEAQKFRQLQMAMGGAVVVAVVAVGGLYVHAKSGVSSAQDQLNAAQARQSSMQQKLSSLSSVKATYAEVAAKQSELASAMGQEIRWSGTLNDLTFRIPSNVWLTGISAAETSAGSTSGAATSSSALPTDPNAIGTVSFSGVAMKHTDVAAWLDALAREKGFSNPGFSNSTETVIGSRKVATFGSSVSITSKILSNRYTKAAS